MADKIGGRDRRSPRRIRSRRDVIGEKILQNMVGRRNLQYLESICGRFFFLRFPPVILFARLFRLNIGAAKYRPNAKSHKRKTRRQ
jgi:hypothetical protein